jgi:hypothetical protein
VPLLEFGFEVEFEFGFEFEIEFGFEFLRAFEHLAKSGKVWQNLAMSGNVWRGTISHKNGKI